MRIKRRVPEEALGVKDASLLECCGNDRDSRVDWVGDDKDVCLGRNAGNGGCEVADNRGIGLQNDQSALSLMFKKSETHVEKVITGHLRANMSVLVTLNKVASR